MRAPTKRSPWRRDFSSVAPESRRVGRYVLQLVSGSPEVLHRLQDSDFLGALWVQCLPLLDPAVLAELYAEWTPAATDDEDEDCLDLGGLPSFLRTPGRQNLNGLPRRIVRNYLRGLLAKVPRTLLRRLAVQDGAQPTHPSVRLIADCAGLDGIETLILDFAEKRALAPLFSDFLRETSSSGMRNNYAFLASALGLPVAELKRAFGRHGTLRKLGLLRAPGVRDDLEDFVTPDDLLTEILTLAPESTEALLAMIVEPAPASPWALPDFPHLQRDGLRLQGVLATAASQRAPGVNALLFGPPGTGKTEFAQAVAHAAGLGSYRVKTADDDGDGLSRKGRLGAYQLLQRLLRGRSDCLVIFDEVEDAFGNGGQDVLRALFGGRPASSHGEKGWMNRVLEENPVPAVWITNDADSMDPAFLRRFLQPGSDPVEAVRGGLSATRRLLHGSGAPQRRQSATPFDPAFLNLAGGIAPGRLAEALQRNGHGRLCFYGPPGTGKTEFAHVLADALGRELVVKTTSDLVSKYVGETERNLAALFTSLDAEPGQSHRHVMNPSTSARNSSDAEAISLLFFIPTLLVVLRRNRFITIWRTIARLLAAKPLRVRDWSSAS